MFQLILFDTALLVLGLGLAGAVVLTIREVLRRREDQKYPVIAAQHPTGIYSLDEDAVREVDFMELERDTNYLHVMDRYEQRMLDTLPPDATIH